MKPRRHFPLLFCVFVLAASARAAQPREATQPAFSITYGPYLQAPSSTRMAIAFATSHKAVSRVEYATSPDGPWTSVTSSRHGLIDADTTFHSITLENLRPATTYRYRVISRQITDFQPYKVAFGATVTSDEFRFTTLDPDKAQFSFVVFNDRHEKLPAFRQALASVKWQGVDVVFLNGDMLNHTQNQDHALRHVVEPCVEAFASRLPFVLVRGNHETRGSFARSLLQFFPNGTPNYYHTVQHGGVFFLVLDCGEDKRDGDVEYSGLIDFDTYLAQQTRWIRQQIESEAFQKARFRVVLVHIPPGYNDTSEKFIRGKYILDNWGPLFDRGKVDLVLSGHTHRFAELPPQAGRTTYPIHIGSIDTVIRVDVDADGLTVTTTRDDASVISKPLRIGRR